MRNAFADEILLAAADDPMVFLLSGDTGNRLFDKYKSSFPDRFINCGIAEANMIGVAAGMAASGLRPVVYAITPFAVYRPFEQIRVDLCYHKLPAVIVGVGAGLSYASLAGTHSSCEDIAVMRTLPNMTIICPGDTAELRLALRAALALDGPSYLRLGKKGEPSVHAKIPDFKIGKSITVRDGADVCIIAAGNMLHPAVLAGELLGEKGISARVESFHTIKPLDCDTLREVFDTFRLVVTVEEHSLCGGLGGSVAEWLADGPGRRARLARIGTPDEFMQGHGSQGRARDLYGLTPEAIAQSIEKYLSEN